MKLTFNNSPTLFKCDSVLFSIIEYSKNYIQLLTEQIVDFRNNRVWDFT